MKKTLVMVLMALTFIVTACAPGAPPAPPSSPPAKPATAAPVKAAWQEKWDTNLAAAKKEGKVTVATFIGPETRDALIKGFSSRHGIDIEFIMGRWNETLTKIQAERRAGLYATDAIINGNSAMIAFNEQGMLDPIDRSLILPEVVEPKVWFNDEINYFDKGKTGIGMLAQYNSLVLRNTELVKEGEVTSFRDLLKPQWKNKVVMYDPSIGGTGSNMFAKLSIEEWNVEEASKWLRQMLKEQGMILSRDPRLQMEWVAKGKYPIALAVYTDQLVNFLAAGAPIAQQKVKEGGIVTSSTGGLGIFNRPAHPNAAIVFVNWLLGKEGQTVFTSGFGGPSRRKDVKAEGAYAALTPIPGEKVYIEDEERALKKNELMKVSAAIIAEK